MKQKLEITITAEKEIPSQILFWGFCIPCRGDDDNVDKKEKEIWNHKKGP